MTLEEGLHAESPILYAEAAGSKCNVVYRNALKQTLTFVNDSRIAALIRTHLIVTDNEECLCDFCYFHGEQEQKNKSGILFVKRGSV